MATPATGQIRASDINTELGRPSTQAINLNDSLVRALAGKASGVISFNDLRGKELNPSSFNPTDGATNVGLSSNITITYPTNITAGTGIIELRISSASGTVRESFDVTSSSRLTFSGNTLTVNPTSDLDYGVRYYLVIPDYAITGYRGTNTYDFVAETAPSPTSFSPSDGSTNVSRTTNWVVNFNKTIQRGTGTIVLRRDSNSGSAIQSFDAASSSRLTFSGSKLTIDPSVTLDYYKNYYMVIPSGAVKGWGGTSSWNIRSVNTSTGQSYCGGTIICQTSNTRWIVAPDNAQVTVVWNSRNNAASCAQSRTGVGGWFVGSCTQVMNPMYKCRGKWNETSGACYWSSSVRTDSIAWSVNFATGVYCNQPKGQALPTRALKTVTF